MESIPYVYELCASSAMCMGVVRCVLSVLIFFFFSSRRRHTRFDCDWSSDVCSSDLLVGLTPFPVTPALGLSPTKSASPAFPATGESLVQIDKFGDLIFYIPPADRKSVV